VPTPRDASHYGSNNTNAGYTDAFVNDVSVPSVDGRFVLNALAALAARVELAFIVMTVALLKPLQAAIFTVVLLADCAK